MIERLAFVTPPGMSAFMGELLDVISDAVTEVGFAAVRHTGLIEDMDDGSTAFVIVPHEYVAVAPEPSPDLASRTIAFGVEHPGTATFEASFAVASRCGARFEINHDSLVECRRRGVAAHRFQLGYARRWDQRHRTSARDIDVVYLGTADSRRLSVLAHIAPQLDRHSVELFIPPHEPMTRPRPDFLMGDAKWAVLARSRILLNLHREHSTAFEWVRCLEAISNGVVVITEPSPDLDPLQPGHDVIVSRPDRMAQVVDAVLADPQRASSIAAHALARAQRQLDTPGSARLLVEVARALPSGQPRQGAGPGARPSVAVRYAVAEESGPLAVWVPTLRELPPIAVPPAEPHDDLVRSLQERIELVTAGGSHPEPAVVRHPHVEGIWLDVLCVCAAGDGPPGATLACLDQPGIAVHFGWDGGTPQDMSDWPAIASTVVSAWPRGRGRLRNHLLAQGCAPLVLVLDSGDTISPHTLARLRQRLESEPDVSLAYCMARSEPAMVVNALIPELRRLARHAYLGRGYLARRSWLEHLGGFTTKPSLQDLVDHDFWLRTVAARARITLLREVGTTLWPQASSLEGAYRELDAAQDLAAAVEAFAHV